jgi:phenylacetate-coenzyme A ligase PaaK-like adenylate-forming protein
MLDTLHFVARTLWEKGVNRMSLGQIQALQRRRLRRLVAWAKTHSPFYARRLRHIDPDRFELADLPVVTKTEMMEYFDEYVTDRRLRRADLEEFVSEPDRLGQWYQGRYAVSRTSGTQGLKAMIVQDRGMMELLFALQIARPNLFPATPAAALQRLFRPVRLAVVTIGRGFYPSAAALAYAPAAYYRFVNRLWLTHIEPLDEVTDRLNRFRPDVLLAYANVLEILAREALAGRLRLRAADKPEAPAREATQARSASEGKSHPSLALRACVQAPASGSLRQVINMSEPLSEGARQLIEEAFGLPVTNNYATGECMALSVGCPQGHGIHLQADWAVLEVVDRANRPVPAGEPGEKVLLTNLANYVQPFLRYEVGDVVTMSPTPCPCGSLFPLILQVEGRTDEVVWVRDGDHFRQVHPYVFIDVLDEYPPLGWYQLVQQDRNRFLLRAVPAPGRHLAAEELRQVLQLGLRRFGLADLLHVDVEITDRLAPDPKSGKLKRITSRVGPPAEGGRDTPRPGVAALV